MDSIDSEIETGLPLNKAEVFAKVSQKLAEKNNEGCAIKNLISSTQERLEAYKEQLRRIEEEEMPSLMDELGITSLTLTTGEQIAMDFSMHCSITKANEEEAFRWLRENNHGDLIKNEMKVKFNRNEDNVVGVVRDVIEQHGLQYEAKQYVHPQTLKSFIKEQMRQKNPPPQDLFGVYVRRVVEIK